MFKELPSPDSPAGAIFWLLRWYAWPLLKKGKQRFSPIENAPPYIGYAQGATHRLEKRALLSYLVWPFHAMQEVQTANHPNIPQAIEIANALNLLGFLVDVIDWQDRSYVPAHKYDLFLGINEGFGRLLPYMDEKTIKIYYATGTHFTVENAAEAERVEALAQRRGKTIRLPPRLNPNNWVEMADAVLVIGNEFVKSTYLPYNPNVYTIDNSALPMPAPDLASKDFPNARRHFLWIGGTGLLHKGLDLLLEVFANQPHLHLWVCGPLHLPAERSFIQIYREELFKRPNIHPIGWTDIYSTGFQKLTEQCTFMIFPSCAEAMASSVLTAMSRGLIPVVSRETGIDIDGFGFELADVRIETIRQIVNQLSEMDPIQCRRMAEEAYRQSQSRYSLDSFKYKIEHALGKVIDHP